MIIFDIIFGILQNKCYICTMEDNKGNYIKLDRLIERLQEIQTGLLDKHITNEAIAILIDKDNDPITVCNHLKGWCISLEFKDDSWYVTSGLLLNSQIDPIKSIN